MCVSYVLCALPYSSWQYMCWQHKPCCQALLSASVNMCIGCVCVCVYVVVCCVYFFSFAVTSVPDLLECIAVSAIVALQHCHSQAVSVAASGKLQPGAVIDPRMVAAFSDPKAHGQALHALRGCSSRSCLHGPVTVSLQFFFLDIDLFPAIWGLWGGCRSRFFFCPILLSDLFVK